MVNIIKGLILAACVALTYPNVNHNHHCVIRTPGIYYRSDVWVCGQHKPRH